MENTEPMKSVEEKLLLIAMDCCGREPTADAKDFYEALHSYTASREKKAYLEGRESRQSEVDFLRKEAYGDLPLP